VIGSREPVIQGEVRDRVAAILDAQADLKRLTHEDARLSWRADGYKLGRLRDLDEADQQIGQERNGQGDEPAVPGSQASQRQEAGDEQDQQ